MAGNKVLTVSVAAYNVEKYLKRCLDSIVIPEIMDRMEVFIIDDGGTDDSLKIAKDYEDKYPGVFHAIHKENGGYGSTINWSIAHATGKYYKTLDGDDWFEQDGICGLVKLLEETDVDIVTSGYYKCTDTEKRFKEYIGVSDNDFDGLTKVIPIWSITYKTSILKDSGFRLPEHLLYTDHLYDAVPFGHVYSGIDYHKGVYCYYLGRDEQSCTVASRIRNIKDIERVTDEMLDFYESYTGPNKRYIKVRTMQCVCFNLKNIFLRKTSGKAYKRLKMRDKQIRLRSEEIYRDMEKHGGFGRYVGLCRHTGYAAYFLRGLIAKKFEG